MDFLKNMIAGKKGKKHLKENINITLEYTERIK